MISKQNIELIRSLSQKKRRDETGLFVAEGEKIVSDLLKTKLTLSQLYITAETGEIPLAINEMSKSIRITPKEMERISAFKNPSGVLALFKIPPYQEVDIQIIEGLHLVLDGIQDPGNLGTIIRLADWFGVGHIFCSENCVDRYNPKCVQSTMGAIARVNVHYLSLDELLNRATISLVPVYGTFMDGENLFQTPLPANAFVVMGSEGKGISPGLEPFMTKKLAIPTFPVGNDVPESLNVAVSTAIICAEFRRRISQEN
jgi:TrmH family RNA methyltransferase